ncbi:hypothetical protein AVEN_154046-1, partial [Araneus ventricosus]
MTNIVLRNCHRGKHSCGKCEEFFLPNWEDLSNNGRCLYCNHPPVEHELLRKPELSSYRIHVNNCKNKPAQDLPHLENETLLDLVSTTNNSERGDCKSIDIMTDLCIELEGKHRAPKEYKRVKEKA